MRIFAYDQEHFEPAAPVILLQIAAPASADFVSFQALVDTGADCTLVPHSLVAALDLPRIDSIELVGVGGSAGSASVHAALLRIAGWSSLARVVAFADECILGRDVLNRLIARLDGPARRLSLSKR